MLDHFEAIYKENYGKMVAALVAYFGLNQIEIAEDLVQETFLSAVDKWPTEMPTQPESWLFKVCKNKTINFLQKRSTQQTHLKSIYQSKSVVDYQVANIFLDHEIKNNQLRLIFALCHLSLAQKVQVIFILKYLLGFKVPQIAIVLGMKKEAVKKSLQRGKQKIKEAGINFRTPYLFQLKSRLQSVHTVLYLLFNEGYYSLQGKTLLNQRLCIDAIDLTQLLITEKVNDNTTFALLSLMYFNLSRFEARVGLDNEIIDLESQDRSIWKKEYIQIGFHYLKISKKSNALSRFHLEAGISSVHCSATSFANTDWCLILSFYNKLTKLYDSPFFQMNRCIALGYCRGYAFALQEMKRLNLAQKLKDYHLFYVAKGKFLQQLEQKEAARNAFSQALNLAKHKNEQAYIASLIYP